MPMIAATLNSMAQCARLFPQVRKDEVHKGDWVIIRTMQSVYALHSLGDGTFEASGGWFDKKGYAPMRIGIAGATWGGSAIMPQVLAACGMQIEYRNRMVTSPVKSILVIPWYLTN